METEKNTRIQLYKDLCKAFGFTGYGYYALLSLLIDRLNDRFYTEEEITSDFTALENARLLRQLLKASELTIIGGGVTEHYNSVSPIIIEGLIKSLDSVVQKRSRIIAQNGLEKTDLGANMILNKGWGGGGTGLAFRIPYPDGVTPQKEGYSIEELNAIIDYETIKQEEYQNYLGNKWGGTYTRSPLLGHISEWIIESFLPEDWITEDKLNFVFNYLAYAGYLDHKPEAWKTKNIDRGEYHMQGRVARSWIDSYQRIKEKKEKGEA